MWKKIIRILSSIKIKRAATMVSNSSASCQTWKRVCNARTSWTTSIGSATISFTRNFSSWRSRGASVNLFTWARKHLETFLKQDYRISLSIAKISSRCQHCPEFKRSKIVRQWPIQQTSPNKTTTSRSTKMRCSKSPRLSSNSILISRYK